MNTDTNAPVLLNAHGTVQTCSHTKLGKFGGRPAVKCPTNAVALLDGLFPMCAEHADFDYSTQVDPDEQAELASIARAVKAAPAVTASIAAAPAEAEVVEVVEAAPRVEVVEAAPRVAPSPATVYANLTHTCACGTTLALQGARPIPDFDWWLERLEQHAACPVSVAA